MNPQTMKEDNREENMFFDLYSQELDEVCNQLDREDIVKLENMIDDARKCGKHVFVLGNGGSAAAASHWVCDFGKGINVDGSERLKIMAPSDHSSIFSAYGNDNGYDQTMIEQIRNFIEPGDLVISLSVSGSSANLVEAHKVAKEIGAKTISIIGDYDGKLKEVSDFTIGIHSKNYGIVEDIHIILEHAISQDLRRRIQTAEA